MWECTTCGRQIEDLYVLPCQHRFCEACIHSWLMVYIDYYRGNGGRVPCQICWAIWSLPSNGLDAMKQNYNVFTLQRQLQGFSMETNSATAIISDNNNHGDTIGISTVIEEKASDPMDSLCAADQNNVLHNQNDIVQIGGDSKMEACKQQSDLIHHETIISSSRVFNPDAPSVGVCRRFQQYHDYEAYCGHYY